MKRLRLSPIVICLLLAAGIAGWWKSTQHPRVLTTEVYVWQRADSPELRAALDGSRGIVMKRHFLAVEIGKHDSKWRVTRSAFPDELISGNGVVMRIGASLPGESWREGEALDRVLAEAAWMAAKPAAELQIDYDCPQPAPHGGRFSTCRNTTADTARCGQRGCWRKPRPTKPRPCRSIKKLPPSRMELVSTRSACPHSPWVGSPWRRPIRRPG